MEKREDRAMKNHNRKKTKITLAGAVMLTCLLLSGVFLLPAFADGTVWAADRDVEWGCYQNSETNNGVIGDVKTPVNYSETALKWSRKMVSGYTTSFTPPLIIDGCLYTASSKNVYKIDKETGEILQTSDELKLNVGYAMNPITYDKENDQLYVPILKGRVECLDAETLRSKWISEEFTYCQTLSPISYKDGCVYTGIWETETDDSAYLCLDAATGAIKWKYLPSEHGEPAHGFYWAGAYVNDNYVVVGSDDGFSNTFSEATEDGAFPLTAILYCFDRRTGEVVDRITGIKGDIRSSVVYDKGHVYFVSKGGRLYKANFGSNGKFSNISYIQLKERVRDEAGQWVNGNTDAMMTSTPIVYNGRIYTGAAGSGGQFSADGGHYFAVVSDDASLSSSSLIYTVPISGYPQAAPLLSTATEKTDGKVRLFFTFNAFPGGIYYLEDSSASTAVNHENAHLLYRPEKEMQQYCISPLCCDREGTFYFKNDSGNLMAVALNKAYLNDISVKYGEKELIWETPFESGLLNYSLQAPNEASAVDIRLDVPQDMTASIDGKPYNGTKMSVPVGEETGSVSVEVSRTEGDKSYIRTYNLNISAASNNANLAGITINDSNTKPQIIDTEDRKTCDIGVGYDPAFDAGVTEYVSRTYERDHAFLNLWVASADEDAQIRVIPVNNVGNSAPSKYLNTDGTVKQGQNGRYPIYWVKGEISAEVDVEVTSPSGNVKKVTHVTLVRSSELADDVGEKPLKTSPSSVTLYTSGQYRSLAAKVSFGDQDVTEECSFESTDPTVATVDQYGTIAAASRGEAEIWVRYAKENRRARIHVEVSDPLLDEPVASIEPGTYTEPLSVVLFPPKAGASVRYVIGDANEDLVTPTTTSGTEYKEPIRIGESGKKVSVKIRAIACGKGFMKSYPKDFVYTVDLTEEMPCSAGVSLAPDSIRIDDSTKAKFAELPNGTGYETITAMLQDESENQGVKAFVSMTDAYTQETGKTEIEVPVRWEGNETYDYDPEDIRAQNFQIAGQVVLPEGVDRRGSTLHVVLPVSIRQGVVAKPVFSVKAGTYTEDKNVSMSSETSGASIVYTMADSNGAEGTQTLVYDGQPLKLSAQKNEKRVYNIKAYALKNGVKSETVSRTFTIDKRSAPGKLTGLKTSVNASKKKISIQFPKMKLADSYKLAYRKAGGKWKYKSCTKTSVTLTGLAAGTCYEVKVQAVNLAGVGSYSNVSRCLVAKTTVKLTSAKKAFTAKMKKTKGATGYQVRYSLKKNMSGAKTKKTKKTTLKVSKLKSKKVYYIEVTPYKIKKGKTYLGEPVKRKVKTR